MNKKFNGVTVETDGVRSIGGGGTGATTAEQARINLGISSIPSTVSSLTVTGEAAFGIPVETKASPSISANSLTLNLSAATFFVVNLTAPITSLVFSNTPASPKVCSFTLQFTADGTARSVTWPTSVKWAGGTTPTLTSTSGKIDILSFLSHNGGTTWFGFVSGQNF